VRAVVMQAVGLAALAAGAGVAWGVGAALGVVGAGVLVWGVADERSH
jgi:hypothetical protein